MVTVLNRLMSNITQESKRNPSPLDKALNMINSTLVGTDFHTALNPDYDLFSEFDPNDIGNELMELDDFSFIDLSKENTTNTLQFG